MKNVLVLISSAGHPALNDGAIRCAVDVLRAQGATVGAPDWLATDIACDIPFDGPPTGVAADRLARHGLRDHDNLERAGS